MGCGFISIKWGIHSIKKLKKEKGKCLGIGMIKSYLNHKKFDMRKKAVSLLIIRTREDMGCLVLERDDHPALNVIYY